MNLHSKKDFQDCMLSILEPLKPYYSEEKATKILSEEAVTAICDVKMGEYTATAWGCDLTHEYVSINADYRS